MKTISKYIIAFLLFLAPYVLVSQSVALVLSGGGAKAFSHIGVLRALEENNIPIDYVIGNSMGALIGGLYASGYTPEEIYTLLINPEFVKFTKENHSKKACFYQVDEPTASFAGFTFKVDKGFSVQLPLSVYDFKEIDYNLMEFFAGASALSKSNFDSLMIPYRCVASDIDSSRMVVFKDGNLTKAIRASITFPFFVRPIDIDGTLYFDGGMYDNFPVDVAIKEFNPDLIIGSKAVNNYSAPSPDNAISLMQSMLMTKADFEIDSAQGVVIESNTGQGTIFEFNRVQTYIDSGYVAASRMIASIKLRVNERGANDNISARRSNFKSRIPSINLNKVKIKGLNKKQQQYFEKLLGENSRFSTTEEFHKLYKCLITNENIISVYPEIVYDSISKGFDLNLIMKKSDPFNLQVGGYISSSGVNEGYIDFGYNYFGKSAKNIKVGAYFGTFYNSFSTTGKIEFPYKIPITLKLKFLVSRKNYFSNVRYFLEDNFPAYIITDENYLDFSFSIPSNYAGVMAVGVSNINANFQYYQDNYFTRTDTADVSNFYFLSPWFEYEINTFNHKLYPTSGQHLLFGFGYYVGNEKYTEGSGKSPLKEIVTDIDYYSIKLHYNKMFSISSSFSLGVLGEGSFSTKPLLSNYISTLLIATPYTPIPVMKTLFLENYRSFSYGSVGAVMDYNFYKEFNFRVDGYYYVPYQKIEKRTNDNMAYLSDPITHHYFVGSARFIYHPPIGVVSASVNYIERPGSKFGFLVNLGYLIFNKSKLNR